MHYCFLQKNYQYNKAEINFNNSDLVDGGWREVEGRCQCEETNTTTYKFCDDPKPQNGGNICLCRQEDFLNGNFCNGTYAEIFKRCVSYPCPGWREIPGQCACNQMNTTTYQFCDNPSPQNDWSLCNCTELVSPNSCNGTYAEVYESCGDNPCSKYLFNC